MPSAARRRAGNVFAALAGLLLALMAAEAATRLLWDSAPPAGGRADTLPLMRVPDPGVLYRLVPGSSGIYSGTQIQVNSLGLRDRDYAIPRPPGIERVLVLGDSMVFGVGVRPEETLPGQLGRFLAPAEVINAGIFGYNLDQEISMLEEVGPRYRPDVVISCFVHNDIDNWGLGEGGAVPEIRSSRFDPPPADLWSSRLASLLLADPFDADRLNLLPAAGGVRGWLAAHSRLYLFSYTRLRTHSWSMTSGEQANPIVAAPTCQSRAVIWEPLRQRYRRLRETTERLGATLRVVILGGALWEGRPLARLHDTLRQEGIPFLDLTPLWSDRQHYARTWSLGWDPHPNAQAHELAADLVARFVKATRGSRAGPEADAADPYAAIRERPELGQGIDEWRQRQATRALEDDRALAGSGRSLSAVVDFGSPDPGRLAPQILYGFWEPGAGPDPGVAGQGRWMSSRGAVLLGWAEGASRVEIELRSPMRGIDRVRTPRSVTITAGIPLGSCARVSQETRLEAGERWQIVTVPLDTLGESPDRGPIELELIAAPFEATLLGAGGRDPRLVSLIVRRIAVR